MSDQPDTLEVIKLEAVINDYISRELVRDSTLLPLSNATSLLETGVLDSLSLLRLVLFVEERFGIVVDDVDLVPEHFGTVDAICAYLRSRTAVESRPARQPLSEPASREGRAG